MTTSYMLFVPGNTEPPTGPYDLDQLVEAHRAGEIPAGAKVCVVGENVWVDVATVLPPMVADDEFMVTVDGENTVGPVTLDQLRRGLAAGKLPGTARVRQRGTTEWVSIVDAISRPATTPARTSGPSTTAATSRLFEKTSPPAQPPSIAPFKRSAEAEKLATLAKAASDSGNHAEAYRYWSRVLEADPSDSEAWFGKAVAAGWGANLIEDRYVELLRGIQRAVDLATDEAKLHLRRAGASAITRITIAYRRLSREHTEEFVSQDSSWPEHVGRCEAMLDALDGAAVLDPKNAEVLRQAIDIMTELISGIEYEDEYDRDDHGRRRSKVHSLPLEAEEQLKERRDAVVAKLKALDASYEAPRLKSPNDLGLGCVLVPALLVAAAGGLWWWWRSPTPVEAAAAAQPTFADEPQQAPVAPPAAPRPTVAKPSPIVSASPACTPCKNQEDFDAAMKAGTKCCGGNACEADADCPGSRVCCKVPSGTLCGDSARCGANRVQLPRRPAAPARVEDPDAKCRAVCPGGEMSHCYCVCMGQCSD